ARGVEPVIGSVLDEGEEGLAVPLPPGRVGACGVEPEEVGVDPHSLAADEDRGGAAGAEAGAQDVGRRAGIGGGREGRGAGGQEEQGETESGHGRGGIGRCGKASENRGAWLAPIQIIGGRGGLLNRAATVWEKSGRLDV